MHTDRTLTSDSIVTVDAYDRRLETYFIREGIKRNNKGRFEENNVRGVFYYCICVLLPSGVFNKIMYVYIRLVIN